MEKKLYCKLIDQVELFYPLELWPIDILDNVSVYEQHKGWLSLLNLCFKIQLVSSCKFFDWLLELFELLMIPTFSLVWGMLIELYVTVDNDHF